MSLRKINRKLISEDVEDLSISNLRKAYKRYKKTTSQFRNKNVRDPFDHIDFEVNLSNELREIKSQIERGNYYPKRPMVHFAPKTKGISRPTVSLHIEDVIVYRFCVEQIDKEIVALTRQKNIRGGVMASPTPEPEDGEYYEKWFEDWLAHNEAVYSALKQNKFIATTDISSYFDNVEVEVLTELLKEVVKDKQNLVSLLGYFLQGVKLRYGYRTKLNTGLVQDDSDSSRILAYFYLHLHDIRMIDFTNKIGGHFFRYVDDMNVVVKSETDAKRALKTLTDSLRKLGLMASIEKTTIVTREEAIKAMLRDENAKLQEIDELSKQILNSGKNRGSVRRRLESLYIEFKEAGLEKDSAWIKLLRRFYTLATRLGGDFLFDDMASHLIKYPSLIANRKLQRYFLANQKSPKFNGGVELLVNYLESPENLYPQAETEILEVLNCIDLNKLPIVTQVRIQDIAHRMTDTNKKRLRPIQPLSEFAHGMAAYLLYKADPSKNSDIAALYLSDYELPEYTRKCFAIVALTCKKSSLRKQVQHKLNMETSIEMRRLSYFIANLRDLRSNATIKRYKNATKFYQYIDTWKDEKGESHKKEITLPFIPIRVKLLRDMLRIYR
jgi:hypothetical protein